MQSLFQQDNILNYFPPSMVMTSMVIESERESEDISKEKRQQKNQVSGRQWRLTVLKIVDGREVLSAPTTKGKLQLQVHLPDLPFQVLVRLHFCLLHFHNVLITIINIE